MSKIDDIIMEFASNHLEFNADDVFDYCQTREKTTLPYIRKVLMRLVNNGKLIRPSRGVYLKPDKGVFRPQVSRDVMEIYQTLKNKYPFTKVAFIIPVDVRVFTKLSTSHPLEVTLSVI